MSPPGNARKPFPSGEDFSRNYAGGLATGANKKYLGALSPSLTQKGGSFCSKVVSWEAS